VSVIEGGGKVVQETRLFDNEKGVTRSMRSKEEANDYRYFPEPDLPPLRVSKEWLQSVTVPRLPQEVADELTSAGVSQADARTIVSDPRWSMRTAASVAIPSAPRSSWSASWRGR